MKEICKCGHDTKDHSYIPESLDTYLECDKCDCKDFSSSSQKTQGGEKHGRKI